MKAMHMTTRELNKNATERKIWIYNEQQQYNFWQQQGVISRNFSTVYFWHCAWTMQQFINYPLLERMILKAWGFSFLFINFATLIHLQENEIFKLFDLERYVFFLLYYFNNDEHSIKFFFLVIKKLSGLDFCNLLPSDKKMY